jgi:hypothetical protein
LIYRNFLSGNNAQNAISSILLPRYIDEDSKEIYFIFFSLFLFSMHFGNLKKFLNITMDKRIQKREKRLNSSGPAFGPRLCIPLGWRPMEPVWVARQSAVTSWSTRVQR